MALAGMVNGHEPQRSGGRRAKEGTVSEEYEVDVCAVQNVRFAKRLMWTEIIGLYWSVSLLKLYSGPTERRWHMTKLTHGGAVDGVRGMDGRPPHLLPRTLSVVVLD